MNYIPHFDASIRLLGQMMLVMPDGVRTDSLLIAKKVRGAHLRNFGNPRHRKAEEWSHLVFDKQPGVNLGRERADDLEAQLSRRDFR